MWQGKIKGQYPYFQNAFCIVWTITTVETVLLYGSSSWTPTKATEKKLDGTYTRLLRAALNVNWRQHMSNKDLYGDLPKVSNTIRERRVKFCCHSRRSRNEVIHQVLLWESSHGRRKRGRPARTYINQIVDDTGIKREDLANAMEDRDVWREIVRNVRPRSLQ